MRARAWRAGYLSVKASDFAPPLSGGAAVHFVDLHALCVLQLQGLQLLDHVGAPAVRKTRRKGYWELEKTVQLQCPDPQIPSMHWTIITAVGTLIAEWCATPIRNAQMLCTVHNIDF